jgi:exopolyphosphatase/guanosine-5'-triphosphate,3'-diphosphate pyrophosphatase
VRVAAIDCGTNTIKLLVADLDPVTGDEQVLAREMRMVRLGQGVDRTGRLDPAAVARTLAAVDEYAALVQRHGPVDALRFCATSASRDAENADAFVAGVRERLGIEPEVVTGAVEAQLAYDGATRSLPGLDAPVLVVDIGGGSTELILGSAPGSRDGEAGHVTAGHSLDIGSVRVTERLMPSDPPNDAEVAAATAAVDEALDSLPGHGVEVERARTVVGVAGTITTVAAAVLDLPAYDRDAIHHSVLPAAAVHEAAGRLLALTVARRRELPYLHPGRADVIGAGALILDRVLRRAALPELLVSEADILDGIAWSVTESSEGRASD